MPDLTDLQTVKSWQGTLAQANTSGDTMIEGLITATSADFLRAIKRPDLLAAGYTEVRTGDGSCRLVMRHWPLNSISAVTLGGVGLAPSPDRVAAGFYVDETLDPERRFVLYLAGAAAFTDGLPVAITYNAGYTEVPQDIEQAVTEWVVLRYNKKASTGSTQNRGVEGERNEVDPSAIPANTQRVIDQYLREWPVLGKAKAEQEPPQPKKVRA